MKTLMGTLIVLLLTMACQAPGDKVPTQPTQPGQPAQPAQSTDPFKPTLSLRPVAVSLGKWATQTFHAEINYPEGMRYIRQPVSWRVVEPDGGAILGAGLYTAPGTAGIYHVEVRREDFPDITATATVKVK